MKENNTGGSKIEKKLSRNQTKKNIETEKKQSIMKKCTVIMNKTLDNFKSMAYNIKNKIFKGGKNVNDECCRHSCRTNKK